jgi:endonuclease III
MVRKDDGIDLGLWRGVDPAMLLVPVDTHILRVGRHLGAIRARTHSLGAAREITAVLRGADPADPARFDFALCRLGILKRCPTAADLSACRECELRDGCRKRRALERAAARRNMSPK